MGGVYGLIVRRELAACSESDSDGSENEDEKVQTGGVVEEEDEEVSICKVIPPSQSLPLPPFANLASPNPPTSPSPPLHHQAGKQNTKSFYRRLINCQYYTSTYTPPPPPRKSLRVYN